MLVRLVLGLGIIVVCLAVAMRRIVFLVRLISSGQPAPGRFTDLPARIATVLSVLSYPPVGAVLFLSQDTALDGQHCHRAAGFMGGRPDVREEDRARREADFLRVDFYEVDGRPLFGEFCLYPGSGLDPFSADWIDFELGGLWRAAYDPRSALGLAALLGAASARP